jgi:murein L,D-transpeptidase YafK
MTTSMPPSFKQVQLQHPRVKSAYDEKESIVKAYFVEKKVSFERYHLFLRGLKKEMKIEAWVREPGKTQFILLRTYDFCATSGALGPKRREGDLQIPEGIYHINHFNPLSDFHLSLGLNYPNASDKILGDKKNPGSAIYIHGNCVTIGCIPLTDDKIKELYVLSVEAKNNGQDKIAVHIFPSRLDDSSWNTLKKDFANSPEKIRFWRTLQPIYKDFQNSFTLKKVKTTLNGEYTF